MAKFHKLIVSDVKKETAESVSIAFSIPEEIKESFTYKQGQYITLKLNVNEQEIRRSYSICSSPVLNEDFRIAIKKVHLGRASIFLNEKVKIGDAIEVMTPMGNFFTELSPSNKKNYVLFAGGSGITPMISILKSTLHKEPQSTVTLFYGNLNETAIIFKNELDKLSDSFKDRLSIYYILDQPENPRPELLNGMMTPLKVKALMNQYVSLTDDNEFFVCGPSGMMDSVKETLEKLDIEKKRIHIEYFSSPVDTSEIVEKAIKPDNSTFISKVTIICDGDEVTIDLGADDMILDAALAANIDAPYACRGGSCCTCRAKLVEGKVEMKVNYALLDSEVEEGFILTCQSRPLTPTVIVDYDRGKE